MKLPLGRKWKVGDTLTLGQMGVDKLVAPHTNTGTHTNKNTNTGSHTNTNTNTGSHTNTDTNTGSHTNTTNNTNRTRKVGDTLALSTWSDVS